MVNLNNTKTNVVDKAAFLNQINEPETGYTQSK